MTGPNALGMVDAFISSYEGMFGRFSKDDGVSSRSASASSPDGDNVSIVRFDIPDDIVSEFDNRKAFIESKRKRLGPMGKLQPFDCRCDFEDSFGGILNFKLLGKVGGFFFYTAHKKGVLLFIQAYSTTSKGQIPDAERNNIIESACKTI
jgi:hypothetical protein